MQAKQNKLVNKRCPFGNKFAERGRESHCTMVMACGFAVIKWYAMWWFWNAFNIFIFICFYVSTGFNLWANGIWEVTWCVVQMSWCWRYLPKYIDWLEVDLVEWYLGVIERAVVVNNTFRLIRIVMRLVIFLKV